MAAFSYQLYQPFHNLDSVYNLQSSQMRIPGLLEDQNITNNTTLFPQFYQPETESLQEFPPKSNLNESSSCILDQQAMKFSTTTTATLSNNEHSLTNKTCTDDSSSVTDKLECGEEQVTQNVQIMDNKRKSKEGFSVNSTLSKGRGDQARGKKQRKCSKVMKGDEEKKAKEDKKGQKKTAEEAPTGYIHVRARRGQATDSHSLAERVRREKISERMKLLQALVPGCDKVTGKALMLDEIINYVQSLQNQVEFLSMKLASLNPMFYDFGMDLDTLMARPDQTFSNMASPVQNMQQCQQMQPPIISDTNTTTTTSSLRTHDAAAVNNAYSQLDNSAASVLFPQAHHHIPHQILSQANGQLLWDVDEQRQKLINQTGFTNNLCSFH